MTEQADASADNARPDIAVVIPVHNEEANVAPLIAEICDALGGVANFEIVYVDDGSQDNTLSVLNTLAKTEPRLRVIAHAACCGQSAAVATGVKQATAEAIATLDGDGQNDPADLPVLYTAWRQDPERDLLLIAGHRVNRKDSGIKKMTSRIANTIRDGLLRDKTPDTGCGLKVFARAMFMDLPRFDHMHRYLPALCIRAGGRVQSVPVNHRPREHGRSKYGTLDRLLVGIFDLIGVIWLIKRGSRAEIDQDQSTRISKD